MNVAELFAQLSAAMQAGQGELEVVVRAEDDNGSDYCGTVGVAQIETNAEGAFFALDCGPEESDDWDGGEEGDEDVGEGDKGDEAEEEEEEETPPAS